MSHANNDCRWTGKPGHYEVWYLTTNHRESQTGFWIRYTLEAPHAGMGEPRAQLWFGFFDALDAERNLALTQDLPISALRTPLATAPATSTRPFVLHIGDSQLTHSSARGAIAGSGHEVSWDLHWQPAPRAHLHLPRLMYQRGGLGETTVLGPNLDVAISGTIIVDGRSFELLGEPGGQSHLWGKKHAYSWAWGHCNAFEDHPGAVLEALSVRLLRAGRVLPALTMLTLYLDGEEHRMSEFRHVMLNRCDYGTAHYAFRGQNARTRIEGEFTCQPENMMIAPYEDPDGEPSYCANTEIGNLRLTVYQRHGLLGRGGGRASGPGGWPRGWPKGWYERTQLIAKRTAHFEVGSRTRDPAITREFITVSRKGAP